MTTCQAPPSRVVVLVCAATGLVCTAWADNLFVLLYAIDSDRADEALAAACSVSSVEYALLAGYLGGDGLASIGAYLALGLGLVPLARPHARERWFVGGLATAALACCVLAAATGFWSLCAATMLSGVASGATTVLAAAMVNDAFRGHAASLASANGVLIATVPVGAAFATLCQYGARAPHVLGWRRTAAAVGGAMLLLGAPVAATLLRFDTKRMGEKAKAASARGDGEAGLPEKEPLVASSGGGSDAASSAGGFGGAPAGNAEAAAPTSTSGGGGGGGGGGGALTFRELGAVLRATARSQRVFVPLCVSYAAYKATMTIKAKYLADYFVTTWPGRADAYDAVSSVSAVPGSVCGATLGGFVADRWRASGDARAYVLQPLVAVVVNFAFTSELLLTTAFALAMALCLLSMIVDGFHIAPQYANILQTVPARALDATVAAAALTTTVLAGAAALCVGELEAHFGAASMRYVLLGVIVCLQLVAFSGDVLAVRSVAGAQPRSIE